MHGQTVWGSSNSWPVNVHDGWVLTRSTTARPRFALAPMEGVSDATARHLLSELGGMDLCVTEFIRVTTHPLSSKVLRAACPELDAGGRTPSGVPVVVQLLGSNPESMAETARRAVQLGALGIDINFGCPARRVNGHDGGAAILQRPERIAVLVRSVRNAVPPTYPVSAKIRLGWSDPREVIDIVTAAEAGGAAYITIHGRTKAQLYKPSADWNSIGMAREAVHIPVVANGDLFKPSDVERCRAESGCSAFMLGRGAFRTPNLFRWCSGEDSHAWPPDQAAQLLRRFVEEMRRRPQWRVPDRAILARLKQWNRYLSAQYSEMAQCFEELKRTTNVETALKTLDDYFPIHPQRNGFSTIPGRTQSPAVLL